jgi:hypothetical protein
MLIFHLDTATPVVWNMPLTSKTTVALKDEYLLVTNLNDAKVTVTIRHLDVQSLASQSDRVQIMRLKAALAPSLPIRSMLMLADPIMPLTIVPGVSSYDQLYVLGLEADQFRFTFTQEENIV